MTLPALLQSSPLTIFQHQDGVTIGLEVLLPKEAKLHPENNPPLQYDVFLYKIANNGDPASPSQGLTSHSSSSYPTTHPIPRSPNTPKTSKVPKSNKSPKQTKEPLRGRHSSPGRHRSPGRHPSPSRHSAPGCYSSPICRMSSHHSPSHFRCMPTCSPTPPQLRRPRGRSQDPEAEASETGREYYGGHIRPFPSSPHLTQPPPSPSRGKYCPVSTRSLPPLSWPGLCSVQPFKRTNICHDLLCPVICVHHVSNFFFLKLAIYSFFIHLSIFAPCFPTFIPLG